MLGGSNPLDTDWCLESRILGSFQQKTSIEKRKCDPVFALPLVRRSGSYPD